MNTHRQVERITGPFPAARPSANAAGGEKWESAGVLHRVDGPAVVLPSGELEWWVAGRRLPAGIEKTLSSLWASSPVSVPTLLRLWEPDGTVAVGLARVLVAA